MAQGMREGMRLVLDSSSPKMWGKDEANDVAPCTAPKWILPIQELARSAIYSTVLMEYFYLSLKPKTARATFRVTCFDIRVTFR
jgi:hypothetical protein